MYTVQLLANDKRRSHPDMLFSESMVSFPDSPFKFPLLISSRFLDPLSFGLWHREVIASSAFKAESAAAEQRALLVFPARTAFETSLRND